MGLLESEQGAQLCLIREISSGGLRADLDHDLPSGTKASIELNTGHRLQGSIIWFRDGQAGMEFEGPVDVEAFLAAEPAVPNGYRPRLPRIGLNIVVTVRSGSRIFRVLGLDISQGGMKIATDEIEAGSEVAVLLADYHPIHGVVRWSNAGRTGIAFNQLLPLRCLNYWAKARRLPGDGVVRPQPIATLRG